MEVRNLTKCKAFLIIGMILRIVDMDSQNHSLSFDLYQEYGVFCKFSVVLFVCVAECLYICIVFFIVLDLRLTKVGVQRYSFFFVLIPKCGCFWLVKSRGQMFSGFG